MAGLSVPPGIRCLMADVGGVGRDFPLSMEKLSPILAFYVVDGVEQGRRAAVKCWAMVAWATLPACIRGRVRQQFELVQNYRRRESQSIRRQRTARLILHGLAALDDIGLRFVGRKRDVR